MQAGYRDLFFYVFVMALKGIVQLAASKIFFHKNVKMKLCTKIRPIQRESRSYQKSNYNGGTFF